MKKGTIITLCISIPVGVVCAIAVAVIYLLGLFSPAYPYYDGVLLVDGRPYAFEPSTNWQPKGETQKIGWAYDKEMYQIYQYEGDKERYFMLRAPLISDMISLPMHRTDITFPSFSPDVIDTVTLSFDGNMIRQDNAGNKQITITDRESIALLANCLSNPIKSGRFDDLDHFSISAESAKYPWMTYIMGSAIYDGKYYLYGRGGMMYEIPLTLLEKISGLDLYSAEEYEALTKGGD